MFVSVRACVRLYECEIQHVCKCMRERMCECVGERESVCVRERKIVPKVANFLQD